MIIKICGIKNVENLLCCEANNVDFYGMIFYKKSSRNISIKEAKQLQNKSKKMKIEGVGVFVNEPLDKLKQYIQELRLNLVQLHGNETNDYIKEIQSLKIKVIKNISIRNSTDLNSIKDYKDADFFLFDYKPEKEELPGGNAKSFNWNLIKNIQIKKPWFLSGGINLNNIQQIKSEIKPYGIDLSSGVEKKLGIKDNHSINNFMSKINNA